MKTKERKIYILEIDNTLNFINHMDISFICTNQDKSAGVISEDNHTNTITAIYHHS